MDEMDSDRIPNRVKDRVRMNAHSFIKRDVDLTEKYRYGDEISHEPVKGIQKEIDGMARLLYAIVTEEEVSGDANQYVRVYQEEVENLHGLEEEVISELPQRERNK